MTRTQRRSGVLWAIVAGGSLASWAVSARSETLYFVGAERPEEFQPAITAYEKANPGTSISYTQVPFDALNAQIQARVGSQDSSIDLYAADPPRIPAFAKRGYLLDLTPYHDQVAAGASKTAISAVSFAGKIWAFPMWTSTQLLFVNSTLLQRSHVAAPSPDPADRLTWDALLELARQTQKSASRWGFTFEQVDRYYQLQMLFSSAGGGSGLTGIDNLTPDITGPAWRRMATWYSALFKDGISPRGVSPEQTPDLFATQQVAFFVGGPWNFPKFNSAKDLHYTVAPVPYVSGGHPSTPTDSWAVAINPYAAHKDAAVRFAEFLSLNREGNYLTVRDNPLIPTNPDAYTEYLDGLKKSGVPGPSDAAIITYELSHTAVQRPRSVGYVVFEEVMNRTFSDIRNGAEVASSLTKAQGQLTSTLARVQ